MQRQGSFSQAEYAGKKKQTRRDKFLAEMEQVVPWARLVERLRPFYPKGERRRRHGLDMPPDHADDWRGVVKLGQPARNRTMTVAQTY